MLVRTGMFGIFSPYPQVGGRFSNGLQKNVYII